MTWLWLALAGLALVALLLLVALSRLRRRTTRQVEAARAESAELRARLDRLEREQAEAARAAVREPVPDGREYTITRVGEAASDQQPAPAPVLQRAVFADLVARESVIRIGSLAHGLRRALDPETRNRIRFEMRREVKRARRRRRTEQREAYRAHQARERDALKDTA